MTQDRELVRRRVNGSAEQQYGPRLERARCMVLRSMWLTLFCGWLAFISPLSFAQQKPSIAGDYVGSLGPLHLKLHLSDLVCCFAGWVKRAIDS